MADEVLSRAFAAEPDQGFARAGAMFTDAVDLRTILLLLRIRYLLREQIQAGAEPVESFAEEIVLAACQREDGGSRWLEPLDRAGRALADGAAADREHVQRGEAGSRCLGAGFPRMPTAPGSGRCSIIASRRWPTRTSACASSPRAPKLEIHPHEPPDIMGCFVLVPTGRAR